MIDLQSILGYSQGSPFAGNPYLDIHTPEGLIDMSNTPIDLMGIDNKGNKKKMKAGRKNPYRFDGDIVREIPTGNPYQKGGITGSQMFKFLFDDEEAAPKAQVPTAPSAAEVPNNQPSEEDIARQQMDEEQYNMAMDVVNSGRIGNPYLKGSKGLGDITGNYSGDILSSGQFGSKNVGAYGKQIYGEVASLLGYKPVVNSIYRSEAQNNALIAAGAPAVKNSWHLTGNAIDLKPADWYKLSNEQQAYIYQKYDVVHHNNHFHIEPK